ncbi:MAG: signal peptidase II [Candidatus Gastranaerophilaceae bacterium]|jgi:signal peptidase II
MIKKVLSYKKISNYFIYVLAILFVFIDQFSKHYVDKTFHLMVPSNLIPNFVSIQKVYNTGAAFSMLEGNVIFLSFLSIVAIIFIIGYLLKSNARSYLLLSLAWGLLLGGTIGNLFDRVVHGYVIDFINLSFINFPVFNFADIFINIGAFIVIVYIIFENSIHESTHYTRN